MPFFLCAIAGSLIWSVCLCGLVVSDIHHGYCFSFSDLLLLLLLLFPDR
jgi:hypothetical protein